MSNIFEERQAFNFYKSYYKTSLLLDTENRAEFLDCILHYQFTGELKEPVLPMASLAFNGQIHSLKKQVNGFARGKETYPTGNPTKGTYKGKDKGKGKEVQEKGEVQEEEQEQEEDKVKIFRAFAHLSISVFEINQLLKKGYSEQQIDDVLNDIQNYKRNKEYTSLYLTANKWLRKNHPEVTEPKKETTRRNPNLTMF